MNDPNVLLVNNNDTFISLKYKDNIKASLRGRYLSDTDYSWVAVVISKRNISYIKLNEDYPEMLQVYFHDTHSPLSLPHGREFKTILEESIFNK